MMSTRLRLYAQLTAVSMMDCLWCEVLTEQRELLLTETEPTNQPVTPRTHVQSAHQRELNAPLRMGYQWPC